MTSDKKTRRQYSAAQKALVLAECGEPGASVAKVAMGHGINANVVHRWRQLSQDTTLTGLAKTSKFIALPLPAPTVPAAVAPDVRVELRRGPVSITVTWPVGAAAELAAWTRELLR
jgi:transposase